MSATLTRAAFDALDNAAKRGHLKSGGRIVDDAPPAGSGPHILDGRRRLQAIENQRVVDANSRLNDQLEKELAEQRAALGNR